MNLKKSINVALATKGMKKKDFAEKLGVSPVRLSYIQNQTRLSVEMLNRLANALDLKVSEFIEMGE